MGEFWRMTDEDGDSAEMGTDMASLYVKVESEDQSRVAYVSRAAAIRLHSALGKHLELPDSETSAPLASDVVKALETTMGALADLDSEQRKRAIWAVAVLCGVKL